MAQRGDIHDHLLLIVIIPFALIFLMPSSICDISETAAAEDSEASKVKSEYETRDGRDVTSIFEGIVAGFGLVETTVAGFNYMEAGIEPNKVYASPSAVKNTLQDCGAYIKQGVNLVSGCLPKTGGRVILDRCFVRVDN